MLVELVRSTAVEPQEGHCSGGDSSIIRDPILHRTGIPWTGRELHIVQETQVGLIYLRPRCYIREIKPSSREYERRPPLPRRRAYRGGTAGEIPLSASAGAFSSTGPA